MNKNGGELLVGIDDEGRMVGIEEDYSFVKSNNRDGWEQWLINLIISTLGKVNADGMTVRYCGLNGKTTAHIEVHRAGRPVFAAPTKAANPGGRPVHGEKKFFYVRMANGTQELAGKDMLEYIEHHWPT